MTDHIRYEHPLSERIRNFLRLEHLFARFRDTSNSNDACAHHTALFTLFEIMEAAARAELKLDILQELERQKTLVGQYPQWSAEQQQARLDALQAATQNLQNVHQKFGQHLRENEWLMAIKNRAAIPGGVCEFDLPSYHWWLHRPVDTRREALEGWTRPMLPLRDAAAIVLRLLRSSGRPKNYLATLGQFQLNLGGSAAQMVRITVDRDEPAIPEVSANKYFLNIRFTKPPAGEIKARGCERDVAFDLTFCNL